ncbi:hypothetical protein TSUD_354250 [Trifolium subterraneum]|uniref:Uncharacterized protein n=1 Tax=Trifolium subterraneum TaxID=3900 RepID=A0A2Z6M7Z9_TRISU|nr:hypothetical protein TSUD_354250 [Trifolium subterraneum]
MLPGGYRSFFSHAFPSIHPPLKNTLPPPPPMVFFYYAVDIFLEPEPKPFCSAQSCHLIFTKEYVPHPLAGPPYFRCPLYHFKANFKFITVKKDGYEEYLKQRLRFSCVAVDHNGNRVGSLFNGRPVSVQPKNRGSWMVKAVYEIVLPGPGPRPCLYNSYTEMVKCGVNVNFEWKDEGEDKFRVVKAYLKMKDMNRKPVWERHGANVLLNAIGRKRGEEENAQ